MTIVRKSISFHVQNIEVQGPQLCQRMKLTTKKPWRTPVVAENQETAEIELLFADFVALVIGAMCLCGAALL